MGKLGGGLMNIIFHANLVNYEIILKIYKSIYKEDIKSEYISTLI